MSDQPNEDYDRNKPPLSVVVTGLIFLASVAMLAALCLGKFTTK